MIITIHQSANLDEVRGQLAGLGLWVESVQKARSGETHIVTAESSSEVPLDSVERVPGVSAVSQAPSAHPRVDQHGPAVTVGAEVISSARPVVISGPCAVESEAQILRIARTLAEKGVKFLRGGAFKPRTSPYAFQGHGRDALSWLKRAADETGMQVVTEVMSEADVETVAEQAAILQVGSRSMQSFALLKAIGRAKKPVLLKRSMSATVEEWLLAGEYLLSHGATGVLFCERGVRGFDPKTRNLLDLGAVALLAHVYRVPVIVDPSHATGRRDLVLPLARAALAAGASGVMVEAHDDPAHAQSDGPQAVRPDSVGELVALARQLGAT